MAESQLNLCFIGNAHSVHIKTFLRFFVRSGHRVTLISPDLCLYQIPGVHIVNMRSLTIGDRTRRALRDVRALRWALRVRQRIRTELRHLVLPDSVVLKHARAICRAIDDAERASWNQAVRDLSGVVQAEVDRLRPDLVQSLRFYPEGLICGEIDHPRKCYFIWGSDITGFGTWYSEVGDAMRVALTRCQALLHDNMKDYRAARAFGLRDDVPHLLVPSNGGIDTGRPPAVRAWESLEPRFATIRRMGNLFMDNEPVLRALSILRHEIGVPATYTFVGEAFGHYYDIYRVQARSLGVWRHVSFMRPYAQGDAGHLIATFPFQVSPARDDGCSNALLETMWHGGVPVYTDLEPIREWIRDGENGYLFDLRDPQRIAEKLMQVWSERERLPEIAATNQRLVLERADYATCMKGVEAFYARLA